MKELDLFVKRSIEIKSNIVEDLIEVLVSEKMTRKKAAQLANEAAELDPYPDQRMIMAI